MPSHHVFYKPSPSVAQRGHLAWGPQGSECPHLFHIEHEEIPLDATNERKFECSPILKSYLVEFYQTIRPLLIIPSFDSESLCALQAQYLLDINYRIPQLVAFARRVRVVMLAWKDLHTETLPPNSRIAFPIPEPHISCMPSESIELKLWAYMDAELKDYEARWNIYSTDLRLRHEKFHLLCSVDFHLHVRFANHHLPWLKRAVASYNPFAADERISKKDQLDGSIEPLLPALNGATIPPPGLLKRLR
ncbi:hypothetical protein B0H16DRAFT_1534811 [Mycena metata]|uniref:Uncharacterized protein n=1 Tax=Mycena metata TaxID=1033252 RepID=A0AAD7J8Q0_9AGAR|nr:hypothetical protein B0H16DRAFT_1534811 [Mycena metata]